jgi:hypothetical protein
MPRPNRAQENTLLYLRLAAICRNLALDASESSLKARLLQLAVVWTELADETSIWTDDPCNPPKGAG